MSIFTGITGDKPLLLLIVCMVISNVSSQTLPRGVSRAKGSFYQPGKPFQCIDGSLTIPFDQINDDYCDCKDGSDEPGTSACRNGKFFCVNKGYKPETIPSSRVSDGVCDCCDGSDEYEGKATCKDTCIEMGKSMREELKAMRQLIEEGHRIRSEYSVQGKQAKADKQQELVNLGPKREALQQKKDELMAKKAAAEEPEKAAKDVHEAAWKEQQSVRDAEKDKVKAAEAFADIDTSQDQLITLDEMQARKEFDSDKDGNVTPEEVLEQTKFSASSADLDEFVTSIWPEIKDKYSPPHPEEAEPVPPPPTEEPSAPGLQDDNEEDDDADFEEDDFEDDGDEEEDTDTSEHATHTDDDNLMPPYPEETQQLIKLADAARTEHSDAEQEFNNVNNQINDIEKFLAQDMGPDDAFYPLRDQCYEFTDREYTYKFCPFEKCSQRPKNGGSETSLGTFSEWEANEDEKYGFMKFTKGLNCWNGPDRSANVKFICGRENSLTNAAEPNRCEYTFDFTTPAACHTLPEDGGDGYHHDHTEL